MRFKNLDKKYYEYSMNKQEFPIEQLMKHGQKKSMTQIRTMMKI